MDPLGLILSNVALLALLGSTYALLPRLNELTTWARHATVGGAAAVACIGVMVNAWQLEPGLIFDTRSVVLAICGLFFGLIPTLIATCAALAYRALAGGIGMWMGLSVIALSAAIGVVWRRFRRGSGTRSLGLIELYGFGLVVHATMLACVLALPAGTRAATLGRIWWPILLIYPVATVLLGRLLSMYRDHRRTETELREGQALLRERTAMLERAQRVARIGSWAFDLKTGTVEASREARRIYGMGEGAYPIEAIQTVPLPEHRETLDLALEALINEGTEYDVEFKIRRPQDGQVVDVRSLAEYDAEARAVTGVIQDVTEARAAMRALRESEQQYRLLADNTVDCIWTLDLDLRFTYVNRAVTAQLGYTPEEFVGTHLSEHCDPAEFEDLAQLVARQAQRSPSQPRSLVETRLKDRNGDVVPVEIRGGFVYGPDGEPTGLQGVTRDVRERRELEERIRQSQKMEAIGLLAGGVAHDFNNILTAILGGSELLLMDLPEGPMSERLGEIREQGRRAAKLTRQLLAFSRRQTLEPKVLVVNDAIEQLTTMLSRLIGENIGIEFQPAADLWPARVDPGQFEQVVVNLVVNARDAMPEGGRLVLETANCTLDGVYAAAHLDVEPGEYVRLAVSDTGIGMNEKTRGRIFEPFFTTKERGQGTGLGLSTVYGIVAQHNGHMAVHSVPGEGSTFEVYLPRGEGRPDGATPGPELTGRGDECILVVEDEPAVREIVRAGLADYGYEVHVAGDGAQALAALEALRSNGGVDLLLSDVMLPDTRGPQLFEDLRRRDADLRVCYMSGYADGAILEDGMLQGGAAFLHKPFTPTELVHKLRQVLDSAPATDLDVD